MSITLNITINVKVLIAIIFIIIIALILIYKKQENFLVGNESVANITKIYADVSGTANFNNIKSNKITSNEITSNQIRADRIDISGKIVGTPNSGMDIGAIGCNGIWSGDSMINNSLLFMTQSEPRKYDGMHMFWMRTGTNGVQDQFVKNPDEETYSADKWVCVTLYSFNFNGKSYLRTYVDTTTNKWCVHNWIYKEPHLFDVLIICYPIQMFSKVWTYKNPHTPIDAFYPVPVAENYPKIK